MTNKTHPVEPTVITDTAIAAFRRRFCPDKTPAAACAELALLLDSARPLPTMPEWIDPDRHQDGSTYWQIMPGVVIPVVGDDGIIPTVIVAAGRKARQLPPALLREMAGKPSVTAPGAGVPSGEHEAETLRTRWNNVKRDAGILRARIQRQPHHADREEWQQAYAEKVAELTHLSVLMDRPMPARFIEGGE